MNKVLTGIIAVAALSAGFWISAKLDYAQDNDASTEIAEARKKYSPIQGNIINPARKIAVPELVKDDGSAFTLDNLKGKWHLLFFGYTSCPDICPVTMGVVSQAKKRAADSKQLFPEVVFVSVDPERDNVEMLGDYVDYFDQDFYGVTGSIDKIKAFTLQLSIVYMKMAPDVEGSDNYLVDHSAALLLLNPDGKFVATLSPPHDPKTILKDLKTIIGH